MKKELYTTVFCQAFSACGGYLAAGDGFGNIACYDVKKIVELSANEESLREFRRPELRFSTGEAPVYALVCDESHLIAGTSGLIQAYKWSDILKKNFKMAWNIPIESDRESLSQPEVNSLELHDNRLYVGSGNHDVQVIDLETRIKVASLRGHSDYIHVVRVRGDQCVSASEDGSVRFWDTRQNKEVSKVEPHTHSDLERGMGKWIGALDVTDDWMVCGGGPRLALWHLRSLTQAAVCDVPAVVHEARFHDGLVLAGGDVADLHQFTLTGERAGTIPTDCSAVFTVLARTQPTKLMTIGGCGKFIEVCTSNKYKDFSLSFL
ncbi:THO complex subunit 6 [Amphibalanus amphitrite]|uniref:THO complex subunit 6 n=1 Tax=Amphibalanus amphitrite TaxID=1232801 RepID=A0A6A4X3N9_AMPAM|nr:THO complex subunit 6 homolog [Amphibalanus amphitrite]XP_043224390.1 THO complex subunit 6 homolog [Amphibalanus amphitrite]XP_043224391.1 THO complex subunit 6 homolog [Amphibalanus amphitrite]XP_043224392.1 THO complex subunit 6 homolog [Amphibalanus amphitrite]XP_043224393.1 THO complex subunit 6 homolog [Amphibalanus amphitrite]XP_043224394.1 THO complex subunit 6 homolog [Amphibalanus amphitrite]XP_043224395.1 THO complex subunit 6 homolog [Amphibalanus amphitrite]XP_043224396.1 THO